jgi:hypothetical protein
MVGCVRPLAFVFEESVAALVAAAFPCQIVCRELCYILCT